MWTKLLIFLIVFFIVAHPSTFKIMRKLLGSWVASADGAATPAGLILHAFVFVALAVFLPKMLMRPSYFEEEYADGEEYEDEYEEEYEEEYEGEEYADEEYRRKYKRHCYNRYGEEVAC